MEKVSPTSERAAQPQLSGKNASDIRRHLSMQQMGSPPKLSTMRRLFSMQKMSVEPVGPCRQHPYEHDSPSVRRRNSFTAATLAEIGKGNTDDGIPSPRKAFSTPSITEDKALADGWQEIKKESQPEQPTVSRSELQETLQPKTDDVSKKRSTLNTEGESNGDDGSDSDGSSYSSVCSDEERPPASQSSSSLSLVDSEESSSYPSTSPLLQRDAPAIGMQPSVSQRQGSIEHEPSLQERTLLEEKLPADQVEDKKLEKQPLEQKCRPVLVIPVEVPWNLDMPPQQHQNDPQQQLTVEEEEEKEGENAAFQEEDLPDWLQESSTLPVSPAEPPPRSTQKIEDEIRLAVDSAAARVEHELGRREQFQRDLQTAASCSSDPVSAAASETVGGEILEPSTIENDSERFLGSSGDIYALLFGDSQTEEMQMPIDPSGNIVMNTADRDLLLIMEVVIGDGRTKTIQVYEGDQPDALAAEFAQKHGLKPEAVPKLRQHIQDQLDALSDVEQEERATPLHDAQVAWASASTPKGDTAHIASLPAAPTMSSKGIDTESFDYSFPAQQAGTHERENHREHSYNNLMAKYGHYTQHSGSVDPEGTGARQTAESVERARVVTFPERLPSTSSSVPSFAPSTSTGRSNSIKKKGKADPPAVFDRLYSLAESRDKWIERAQKAKAREQEREEARMQHVNVMAAKSRELVANRNNGGYANIGERLHEEALSDLAKRERMYERRAAEREEQADWMCPKCAYVNEYNDLHCQNVVALAAATASQQRRDSSAVASILGRRETASSISSTQHGFLEAHPEVLCGQRKPDRLFRPTLLTASAGVTKALAANMKKAARVASVRRQRHQQAMEEEFHQTCPFRPKINEVSEEIVREKLETAALMSAAQGESRRTRDPYLELYEDSFQARTAREEREQAYLKQFSFKPDIGVNSLWVASDRSQEDFVERLAVDRYQDLERKRVALQEKYASDRDPNTGRELFKPETGRAPAFARNERGLPIGEFLYEAHLEQQEYHRQLRERDQREVKSSAQQGFVSKTSRQALERRKQDTCTRIFDALLTSSQQPLSPSPSDSPDEPQSAMPNTGAAAGTADAARVAESSLQQPGEPSPDVVLPSRVDLTALPAEISQAVAIVFEFANHEPISRDAFIGYMDCLVREVPGLTYTQVLFLADHLDDGKGKKSRRQKQHESESQRATAVAAAEKQELTFCPAIDKNSRVMATKHGRVDSSKVFRALNQYFDHYRERKEQLRKQHQREFDRAHPFQPTLVTKTSQRTPAATAFYDKIFMGSSDESVATIARSAVSPAPAPASYSRADAVASSPLQTAIAHARPYVRPIESDTTKPRVVQDEAVFTTTMGPISRSSSSSQLLEEDAELTSRVLAALDEMPAGPPPTPAAVLDYPSSYPKCLDGPGKYIPASDSTDPDRETMEKAWTVRSAETAPATAATETLSSAALFDLASM